MPADAVSVDLRLTNVSGGPIRDPQTIFTFRQVNSNRQIGGQLVIALDGNPVTVAVPALRGDAAACEIDPQRYRFGQAVFLRTPGATVTLPLRMLREPNEGSPSTPRGMGCLASSGH